MCRDNEKRPDGVTPLPWEVDRQVVWDATCIETLAAANSVYYTVESGFAAKKCGKPKMPEVLQSGGSFDFCTLGFETLGRWGPSAISLVSAVGRVFAVVSGDLDIALLFGRGEALLFRSGMQRLF